MATFVIGDIHGCLWTLERLLEQVRFVPNRDRLWLVGDLVNRGPRSLEVLRWCRDLGEHVVSVLGNHDLHLLARWLGVAPDKGKDTLNTILMADDGAELVEWLRCRPLLYCEGHNTLVHAGMLPQWSLEQARAYSQEVELALRGEQASALLKCLAWKTAPAWDENLPGMTRLGCVLKSLTQLRTCTADGIMCLDFTAPPHQAPPGCKPWFSFSSRRNESANVFFGHWAALGLHRAPGLFGLDTNCVRGGTLTAVRLEDEAIFQQQNIDLPIHTRS